MGTISDKLTYLNTTKTMLRDSLNKFGSNILTTDTFRSYDTKLNDIYDKLPKVTQSGAGLTITPVQNGQVDDFKMIGVELEQETVETITVSDWEQGTIDTNGTLSNSTTEVRTSNFIKVYPNILYNISRTIYNSFMKFRFYDNNKNYLGSQADINVTTDNSSNRMETNVSSMKLTINDNNVSYIKLVDSSNDLSTIYTITTNNTPSPSYPQDIKVVEGRQVITDKGKNLFDKDNANVLKLIPSGGANMKYVSSTTDASIYIPITGGKTYTVSRQIISNRFSVATSESTPTLNGELIDITFNNSASSLTLQTSSNANYLCVYLTNDGTDFNEALQGLQIEQGSTATDYGPYYNPVSYNIDLNLENIYLAKMPNTDYKNRIYKNNGNWYFEEKVKKVVLDGSEEITIQNIGTDNWYYQISVNCYKTEQLKQMCSHYNNSCIYNSNTYQGIMMLTEGNFVRIRYGEEDTVANFKAWLSNNNVTLWYPLVNTVTTQITNTTLINQLEAISVHTGTNIITISNDNNIIPEIEITRLKELEKLS